MHDHERSPPAEEERAMKLQRVWALLAVLLLIGSLTGCENKTELVAVEREPVAEQT